MPDQVATSIMPGDFIEVSVAPTNSVRDARKYVIQLTLDHAGYSVDRQGRRTSHEPLLALKFPAEQGKAEPRFPIEEFQRLVNTNYDAACGLKIEYELAVKRYRSQPDNGRTTADYIGDAVIEYLVSQHGFGRDNRTDAPYVDTGSLSVVVPLRRNTEPVTWSLQVTPSWGASAFVA